MINTNYEPLTKLINYLELKEEILKPKHMKTAMKELIEELRQTRDEGEAEYRTAYNLAIAIANQHLEKEKEQIMKTARVCYFEGMRVSSRTTQEIINYGEEYYNQTYNQNK